MRIYRVALLVLISAFPSLAAAPESPQSLSRSADSQPATRDVRFGPLPDTNTIFEPADYPTRERWEKRREWLRMQVRVATGLWPEPEKCPLNAHVFGRIDGDGYTIEKVYFESYPGFYVTGNLYRTISDEPTLPHSRPGVLCPHGHWEHGRLEQSETGNVPARCIMLARMGCTVFAYDMIGYNDSKQVDHRINTPELDLWGITSMHLQTWDSVRAIDFLETLPEVDRKRIGVTGASGGGTQTFILAAVDDRVAVTCPVNMISHRMQGGCVCENAPCLRIDTNNMEIAAIFAPKPILMVSATGDWTKETPRVEYPFIKGIYDLYEKKNNVENVHVDAQHNYNQQSREAMYRFFAKYLLGWPEEKANAIKEHDIPAYKAEELLVWNSEPVLRKTLKQREFITSLQDAERKTFEEVRAPRPEELRKQGEIVSTGLMHMIASELPSFEDVGLASATVPQRDAGKQLTNVEFVLTRAGRSIRMLRLASDQLMFEVAQENRDVIKCAIAADDRGLSKSNGSLMNRLVAENCLLELLEPGKPPVSSNPANQPPKFFNTFNRTSDAGVVYDLLTGLVARCPLRPESLEALNRAMGSARKAKYFLIGHGQTGPAFLVVRAIIPSEAVKKLAIRTVIDMNQFDIDSDEAYLKSLNIPHIRRIGGLRTIAAVACNGPIWFHNIGEHFDEEFVKAAGKANGVEVRVTKEKASDQEISDWLQK